MFACECLGIRYIGFAFDFHADIPNLFTQTAFSRYPCEKSIIKLSLCTGYVKHAVKFNPSSMF